MRLAWNSLQSRPCALDVGNVMLPNQISVEIEGIVAGRIIVCSSFFSSLVAREKFIVVSARGEKRRQ